MLADKAPNVVSQEGLRVLLEQGYQAVVVCEEPVERRDTQWRGRWTVRASGSEGGDDFIVVSTRGHLRPREFKTTLGLISFLYDMGIETVAIPLREGTRALQSRPGAAVAPDTRQDH